MFLVNNGRYRRSVFVIRRFLDGVESFTGGFPVFEDIRRGFAEFPELEDEEFKSMSETDYQQRLGSFYSYLALKYPFFNVSTDIPDENDPEVNSNGTDTDTCPIDFPSGSSGRFVLRTLFSQQGNNHFAEIRIALVNRAGQEVLSPRPIMLTTIIKDIVGMPLEEWDLIEGTVREFTMNTGESEVVVYPMFQFRGEGEIRSAQVVLEPLFGEEPFSTGFPNKVTVSFNEPCFLFNHVSNLQQAFQEMISQQKAQEAVNSSQGIKLLGKKDYKFIFEPDQPKRPVFIYPKSWGKLFSVTTSEFREINILQGGAFLLNNNEPFEYTLEIDGEPVQCYVYAARAMVIYPNTVEYLFRF
ncbi:hypothetical protein [Mongoliitalea daihaiensis]|uniref:hypothetical protein n=1 Tax=Mongoliitalea daihaiensis TaxID=2782006 RepID=UPI001F290F80|nr:hypothetical protein [Mongoliitalea daihaiensis]UJP63982.1 hypothetical protein IPZ59_14280 [Mongoliitalea daihaiensis]